ncbi:hypothetical protein BO70DRAFT_343296 [Aspergillus heteromorphus CBS 117.55]|uniref:Uncharacterized protein n=1 Tax=Aspergillus heteromorphus CBS 117.55 TaxID=1448321 RepID=A0A317VDB8_9EURO|nr:uncharacterized protein BO70DRAFT_343296 [Aspergillus heteromorphus CBS 117.55]PWY71007.1 hypothetical protein BO70DRAFT_343296 [Aspergillus heteromorphus CBS 117.55]
MNTPSPTPTPSPTSNINITNINITPGHATILNNCTHAIYIWSVTNTTSPQTTLNQSLSYSEPFRHDPASGGVSLKITTVRNGLYTGAPQTVFAYNWVDGQVWYDLSDVYGDPFAGRRVSVLRYGGGQEMIVWEDGVPPRGSQVRVLPGDVDLVLRVCG